MKDAIKNSQDTSAEVVVAASAEIESVDVMATLAELGGVATENEVVHTDNSVPWIGFHHPKSGKFAEISATLPDLKEGDPYLCFHGYKSLVGVRMQLLGKQYQTWQQTNAAGALTAVVEMEGRFPFKEVIDAVVMVYLDEGIVTATIGLRGPKCRCASDFQYAAELTEAPAWAGTDKFRQQLAKMPARMRVAMALTMVEKIDQTSGSSYHVAQGVCSPLTPDELMLFGEYTKDTEQGKKLAQVLNLFNKKVADLKAKL